MMDSEKHPNPLSGGEVKLELDASQSSQDSLGLDVSAIPPAKDVSLPGEKQKKQWNASANLQNPLNWPSSRKWLNVALVSAQTMLSSICSTIVAAGADNISGDFHLTSTYTPSLPVSTYVLGIAIGPLCWGPLSEMVGRKNIYLASFLVFTALNIGCATSPSIVALSILRIAAGACGSAGPTLGGASIGDMFVREERGRAQALYALGPTFGPVIGPLIGAFVVDRTHSWRWLLWIVVIASGAVTACSAVFLRETYAPFLRRKQGWDGTDGKVKATELFAGAIVRPFQLLFFSPICKIMSFYMAP